MSFYDEAVIRHLLRRAGFGAAPDEIAQFGELRSREALDLLVNFEQVPDDVDEKIGQPGYVSVAYRGSFQPNTVIADARQRYRMGTRAGLDLVGRDAVAHELRFGARDEPTHGVARSGKATCADARESGPVLAFI